MISRNQIKFINSLKQKKFREQHRCFLAEGSKLVKELSEGPFQLRQIFSTSDWVRQQSDWIGSFSVEQVSLSEMERISTLASPSPVLALFEIPDQTITPACWENDLSLVVDDIRDPGNLGTIIRIADWFGIPQVICSPDTVDQYNPKVVQAAMGSHARIALIYQEITELFRDVRKEIPVYGLMLNGKNLYEANLEKHGFILIGNEAHGISEAVTTYVTHKLTIPFYPADRKGHAESLNAAVAAGIVCAEFRIQNPRSEKREV